MSDPPESTPQRASSAELSSLCQSCGLCCDGSLFGRVDLEADEVEGARKRRLRVVGGGRSFEQPCSAFAPGIAGRPPARRRACTIYEERPRSCRRFACRLYEKYAREGGPAEGPLSVVRRARALLASVVPGGPVDAELVRILEESFARA